jgi:PAS domain S-box-containing protein
MTDLNDTVAREIRIRQSLLVVRMIPILIAGNLAGIGVIAQLNWDRFVSSYAVWAAGAFIVLLIPLALNWLRFRNRPRPDSVSKRRIRNIGMHSLLMGLAWAAMVGLFIPAVGETDKVAILTVSGFLWYGSIAILGGMPHATATYIPPFWLAYYVMVMVTGTDYPYTISACSWVAIAAVFITGRQNWIDFKTTVALELEQARITRENLEAEAARQAAVADAQRRMIEAIPFPLVLTLKDGILPVGEQAAKMFKIGTDQLSGRKVEDFFVDPEDQKSMFGRLASDGHYDDVEVEMQDTEGNRFWVLASARPLEYEGEDCFLNSIISIDDRKRAEAKLLEATETVREQNEMLQTVATQLGKYMSPQLYEAIFSGQQKVEIESRRKKLTVFFSDIAGFTETTDQLESEELTALLNQYLTEMSKIAHNHGATVDQFIGDAIVLYFGDPASNGVKEDASACVRMAIAMQKRMRELNEQWLDLGLERTFELRIGINTGYCTVGNFGSEDRMDYTIIGSEVNLAARLEGAADVGGILLANETHSLVKDWLKAEEGEAISVKGFPRPVKTFRVVGPHDALADTSRILHHEQSGLTLTVDHERMNDGEKAKAVLALKEALAQLEN